MIVGFLCFLGGIERNLVPGIGVYPILDFHANNEDFSRPGHSFLALIEARRPLTAHSLSSQIGDQRQVESTFKDLGHRIHTCHS